MALTTLRTALGKCYRVQPQNCGLVSADLNPENFYDVRSAKRFLQNVEVAPSYWRKLLSDAGGALNTHCEQGVIESLAQFLVRGKVRIFEVPATAFHRLDDDMPALVSTYGDRYYLAPASSFVGVPEKGIVRFYSSLQAQRFINSLKDRDKTLSKWLDKLDLASSDQHASNSDDVLLSALASGKVLLVKHRRKSMPSAPGSSSTSASNTPGNRQVELAPEATTDAPLAPETESAAPSTSSTDTSSNSETTASESSTGAADSSPAQDPVAEAIANEKDQSQTMKEAADKGDAFCEKCEKGKDKPAPEQAAPPADEPQAASDAPASQQQQPEPAEATAPAAKKKSEDDEEEEERKYSVLELVELSFSDNHIINADAKRDFAAPEWKKDRQAPATANAYKKDVANAPVCYTRGAKIKLDATFKVVEAPNVTENVEIKGQSSVAGEFTASVSVGSGDLGKLITLSDLVAAEALPNQVDCIDGFDISWQFNPDGTGWNDAGASCNDLYLTLGDPTDIVYWTFLDMSCRAASGAQNEDDFVRESFAVFEASLGDGNGIHRKHDDVELSYYKTAADTPIDGVQECEEILTSQHGIARCGGWATIMVNMHETHGVTSSNDTGVYPKYGKLLIVKNFELSKKGFKSPMQHQPFMYSGLNECEKLDGLWGIGKNNPQFLFANHALVTHSTGIYDPSYGSKFDNLSAWESAAIAGTAEGYSSDEYEGDHHYFPNKFSLGFDKARLMMSGANALRSLAAKYGTNANALFDHPYNAKLKKQRGTMDNLKSGDVLHLPKEICRVDAICIGKNVTPL